MTKKILITLLAGLFALSLTAQTNDLPGTLIKTLEGKTIKANSISNDGNPIIISFWATWCGPCKKELNTIAEDYEDWQDETGVKLVAVSVDDARTVTQVLPYVNGSDWPFEIYLDQNGDLKRDMNVVNVPHTFLLDGNGKVVYSHNSYAAGDEEILYEKVLKLKSGN